MEGKRLGKYHIEKFIGRGSMGAVYKARDLVKEEDVAIKIVESKGWKKDKKVQHFLRSAKLTLIIHHPHLVKGLEMGRKWKRYYLAMELATRGSLANYLKEKMKLPLEEVYNIVRQIIRALHFIHGKGIIHRDIKSSNILLFDNDVVKLSDFDLFHPSGRKDLHKVLPKGTPHYMAPEQIKGEPLTPASDIYSLGVTIYQMLGGEPPYKGTSTEEILIKHLNFSPTPLRKLNPDIPPEVEDCIMKCLEKEPHKRYSNLSEFWEVFHKAFQR